MTVHQYYQYLESLAEHHVFINHVPDDSNGKHFFRGELEEFYMDLRNKVKFPALIAEGFELTYDDDKMKRETSFIIASDYKETKNWDNIYAVMTLCERIGNEVLRRMISDNDNGDICANIYPITAVPLLNEQHLYAGIRYTISVESAFDSDVDETQWKDLSTFAVERLGNYLYRATYDSIPEYRELDIPVGGGCTSFVRDGKLHRHLDWNYDETNEFRVVTNDFDGMAFLGGITDDNMDYDLIGQLPYHVNDGVNKHGIMVSSHVLFNDFDHTYDGDTSVTKLPYIILSTLESMDDIGDLQELLDDIRIPSALADNEYLMQFLVTDGATTYVITPSDNGYELVDISMLPKLANFKWVNKPTLQRNDSALQLRPTGVERWNLIEQGAELSDLRFTKCYETNSRLSEFVGIGGTAKDSPDADLQAVYERAHAAYLTRKRDGLLWQTMHSVVYGANGMEHLWCQENWNKDFK